MFNGMAMAGNFLAVVIAVVYGFFIEERLGGWLMTIGALFAGAMAGWFLERISPIPRAVMTVFAYILMPVSLAAMFYFLHP